jgi:hypothetical protein
VEAFAMVKRNEIRVEGTGRAIALYHVVYRHEEFEEAAQALFKLVRESQARFPNQRRSLFLDIEGHRNEQGGFDSDMFELQKDFLIGLLGRFLSEIHSPLVNAINPKDQENDIPDHLDIHTQAGNGQTDA